ncbi:MAG: DoxX family protein [Cellvibrionaceae bacterium]
MAGLVNFYHCAIARVASFNWLAPLLLRLFLAPVMIVAGFSKLQFSNPDVGFWVGFLPDPNVVMWFGNADWGLGLPLPGLLAFLAGWTEFLGGIFLVLGLATRLVSLPLMFTMVIAITTVHWENGWFAVAPSNPSTSPALALSWVGVPGAAESLENSREVGKRLGAAKSILEAHGNTGWLYEKGGVVILNNGIEFGVTYFIMLLALFFVGAGRYVSVDYWLAKRFLGDARKGCGKRVTDLNSGHSPSLG